MVEGNASASLQPGQSKADPNGERVGCSARGWTVRLRRRATEPGFVVVTDAPAPPGAATEVITTEWYAANAAFDRLMRDY